MVRRTKKYGARTRKDSRFYISRKEHRHRWIVGVTLGDSARLKLDRLAKAWGLNRSRMVEKLIDDAVMPSK